MRILQLTSHLDVGGITTYVLELAEALTARGHQVIVASGGGALAGRLGADGVAGWQVPLRTSAELSPRVAWACWQLSRRLAAQPVDLLHAHTRVAQVAAHWLSRRHRIPYLTTWHGFYRRRLSRRWLPCTGTRTIAISPTVAAHVRTVFRVPEERIRMIPNGIAWARFTGGVDVGLIEAFRRTWSLSPDDRVVGTVSRLVKDKSVWQLIEAFPQVVARFPTAKLVIVGDGPARGQLKHLADRGGLSPVIRFVGTVPETRVPLAAMQVFVFTPATQEGFGLSLLEAMASGVPVVGLRQGGGGAWLLEESQAAILVEPEQPKALASAIIRVLEDAALARHLADQARQAVRQRYDLARVVDEVERVYAECLASAC